MSKIIGIKLTTGEDLIAKVEFSQHAANLSVDDTEALDSFKIPRNNVTLSDVRVISLQPVGQGQMGLALIPWLIGDHEATIDVDLSKHAVGIYKVRDEISDSYSRETSILDIPEPKKLSTPTLVM